MLSITCMVLMSINSAHISTPCTYEGHKLSLCACTHIHVYCHCHNWDVIICAQQGLHLFYPNAVCTYTDQYHDVIEHVQIVISNVCVIILLVKLMTLCSVHRLLGTGEFTDTSNRVWCGLFTGKVADGLRLKIS
ncbi:hypothetical protein EMCRGX_G013090 [Ephydatia muelleri]